MSNLVPKFKLKNFINFNLKKKIDFKFFFKKKSGDNFGFLSQSAWSILIIALWRKKIYKKKNINILIPEYFCNSTLLPLKKLNFNIIFYKINENLEPDTDYLKNLLKFNKPDLILVVDYFGQENNYDFVRDFCKNNDCWLIKDSAHSLKPNDSSKDSDFVFYSPHKILSYPMGSILITNSNGPCKIKFDKYKFIKDSFTWDLQIQNLLKSSKLKTKNNFFFALKWFLKRTIQSFGYDNIKQNKKPFNFDHTPNNLSEFLNPKIDWFSKFIISINQINYYQELDSRLRLSLVLEKFLDSLDRTEFGKIIYMNKPNIFENKMPYYAMIYCSRAQILYDYFHINNIPCITWPDQPKETLQNKFHNSQQFRKERIFVPLFNISLSKKLNSMITLKKKDVFFSLEKIFDEEIWQPTFTKFKYNNLLQSWIFGEFKKKYENYRVYRYFIKDNLGKLIGLVQILQKKFLFISFFRINIGPLVLDTLNFDIIDLFKKEFKKKFNDNLFSFLRYTPELEFNSSNIIINSNKIYKENSWVSSRLHLKDSLQTLMSKFRKEWRKDLKKSLNTKDLKISVRTDKETLDNVIKHYINEAKNKNFKTINLKLINFLRDKEKLLCLICELKNEYTGALCIALHEPCATNLINPIRMQYKSYNINHLLIWNAIIELKKLKFSYLDTGGFDLNNTPGPTNFKKSLNGKNYKLIGSTDIFL